MRAVELVRYDAIEALSPDEYQSAKPFPHVVIENLIEPEALRAVVAEFPPLSEMSEQFDRQREIKSAEPNWERFGPATRSVIAELNSGTFLRSLERLTGVPKLIVDAGLEGAGQHQIGRGGLLDVHAEFNKHNGVDLYRRLNVLVYLNEPWEEAWGGDLELWDRYAPAKLVAPRLGTTVVFTTTTNAMHGHPHPLTCPEGATRKSLALYYYTVANPNEMERDRTTLFRDNAPTSEAARKIKQAKWHLTQAIKTFR